MVPRHQLRRWGNHG